MERKFYTDDFEQLLKEKSDEFRMYPSKRVWHSIYNDLHPGRKWPSIAVSMLLVIVLLMMGYWNNNSSKGPVLTAAITPKNTSTTNTAIAKANTAAYNNNTALQQAAIPAIAYQNPTSIQQPFGIYQINTDSKLTASLLAKNITAQSHTINWNIALGQFSHTPTTITTSSLLNNSTSFSINGLDNRSSITAINNNDELANIIALQPTENNKTIIAATANLKNKTAAAIINKKLENDNTVATINTDNTVAVNSLDADNIDKEKNNSNTATAAISKTFTAANKKITADQDRAFIDDYAFYNKSKRKKWQDRTALEFYITPSVGYRRLTSDAKYNQLTLPTSPATGMNVNESVNQKPGIGAEAGLDIIYSVARNLRIKAGVQINYTNYTVNAYELNHPVLATLLLTDPNTGFPTLRSSTTMLANSPGPNAIKLHNKTYQFSIPVGMALKLSGNKKLEWYAGATIQPSFVMGGKAYLISADRKNYIADASLLSKWNVSTGLETYISYKLDNVTLQAGPQIRYQLFSTYSSTYTVTEKLYNVGVKIGILKNF